MVIAPSGCWDRDCEMANGETLTITMAAPNTVMADRLVNVSVGRCSLVPIFECSMAFSIDVFSIEPFSIRSVSVIGKRDVVSMFPVFQFDRGRSIRLHASIGTEPSAGTPFERMHCFMIE